MGLLDNNASMGGGLLSGGDAWGDPRSSGNAFLAMAQAIAPRNRFVGGLLNYGNSVSAAQENELKRRSFLMKMEADQMQLEKAKRDAANEQGLMGLQSQFFNPGSAGMGGTAAVNGALPPDLQIGAQSAIPAKAPQFDVKGFTAAAMNKGFMAPLDAIKLQQAMAKDTPINKLDVKDFTPASVAKFAQSGNYGDLERMDKLHFGDTGGSLVGVNPFTGQPVNSIPKTGNPFNDLILGDGQGGFRPNSPLVSAKQSIAKSGAPSIRIENKMGDSLAKEIGPILNDSAAGATGAAQQIDAANRIVKAVDSNKVFAGPGASIRLKTAQIGEVLGIGGKDDAEKIANTRNVVRGLAEMTLQGRKQMRGQGAITESESALAERAISGNIDDLTAAEIKQLANASSRSARFVYEQHQKKLSVVRGNPNTAQLAPFYESQPLPEAPAVAPTPNYIWRDGKLVPVR